MLTFQICSSPHFPRSHATPEVLEPPTGDWDGVAPVFRGFMDQFTLVYAQIRWQMTQFSVRVQSVTRFCVESEILDMAQLISTPSPSQTEAHPPAKTYSSDHFRSGATQIRPGTTHIRAKIHQLSWNLCFSLVSEILVPCLGTHERKASSARQFAIHFQNMWSLKQETDFGISFVGFAVGCCVGCSLGCMVGLRDRRNLDRHYH